MHAPEKTIWDIHFLQDKRHSSADSKHALIILNQSFPSNLLLRLWNATKWHSCADGGSNRLYDSLKKANLPLESFKPDLIKGDLDSIRPDVRQFYQSIGVPIVQDSNQDATDLMKCVDALKQREQAEGTRYQIVLLGGLSGRLDQTIHTLSYLHKLRKSRKWVYAVTEDNVGWVLDSGEHEIKIDHNILGQTCGLLPVGIGSTVLSTTGLRWNLTECESSFDGMVSTSNHLAPEHDVVWIKTTNPIWWTAELRQFQA
ncbi:thiamine pyrophosphokinase [Panaeolus papilionaceus]|nr:thiamine pyrophosphokinase [Panaeolus papilionaceus]